MRVGSLFSGIGGLEYGLEMAGMEVIWQVEKNDFCRKVLKKHWPAVPKYEDIFDVKGDELIARHGTVDIICGGFPCQPFSVAGKQRGQEDDRFLWPEMSRIISEVRPTWVLAENVPGIINMALDDVLFDLESKGYTTGTIIIPACATGATHRRDRVWIVGYSEHNGQLASAVTGGTREAIQYNKEGKNKASEFEGTDHSGELSQDVAYAECQRPQRSGQLIEPMHTTQNGDGQASGIVDVRLGTEWATKPRMGRMPNGLPAWLDGYRWPAGLTNKMWPTPTVADIYTGKLKSSQQKEGSMHSVNLSQIVQWPAGLGQAQFDWEPPRVATGVKNRNARLKALGNAVVWQIPYIIGKYIMEVEKCIRMSK